MATDQKQLQMLVRREMARRPIDCSLVDVYCSHGVIYLRGTTEGLNLVAQTYGRRNVGAGDEVLITALEHHSNIVPWQMLCEEKGAHLKVAPIDDAGEVDLEAFTRLVGPRTRIVSVAHVSNALGTILPVRKMAEIAHAAGAVFV